MNGDVKPYVPSGLAGTARGNKPAITQTRRDRRQYMKDGKLVGDVFDLNIVGDHVVLQPGRQHFSRFGIGIDEKAVRLGGNENVRVYLAFCVEYARFDCSGFGGVAQIIGDLPIKKTKTIAPGDAKLCASGKIKKEGFGCLHPSLEETGAERFRSCRARCTICLKKPPRSCAFSFPFPVGELSGAVGLTAATIGVS